MPTLKTRILLTIIGSLMALTACQAQNAAPATATSSATADKPAIIVDGTPIKQGLVNMLIAEHTAQGEKVTPDLIKSIHEDLIARQLLTNAALKANLDQNPQIANELEMSRQDVLIHAYLQDYLSKHPPTEAQLMTEYNQMKAAIGDKKYKVSHILVPTKAEAESIIKSLEHGANFAKLAKAKSKDSGSAAKGGELNWIVPTSVVPPFAQAMMKLKKGQYTHQPVHTQYGWHIIKLDDVQNLQPPPFDQVKPQLTQRLQQQQITQAIAELKSKAQIQDPAR
ncbi:MAG: peptidylprolyl isomerase [Pseudomonadota bacterium]|nr:peptidylprolyl isomerase [Pseudomonadota bacterium]